MTDSISKAHFTQALLSALEETFEHVQGMYLDRNTSIFETLATITAEEASRPLSASCASLAAHVEHMTFYMNVTLRWIAGDHSPADWGEDLAQGARGHARGMGSQPAASAHGLRWHP